MRRAPVAACALVASLAHAARLGIGVGTALSPAVSFAQTDPYKQHMENGIKLFQDGNHGAAIAEFSAAYAVRPKASPLMNIALCHKAQFNYPKAIVALETALAKHADTMDATDKQAAESAIKEMRALLAYVRVSLSPKDATLVVDGEDQPPGAADAVVALSPGAHKIGARAEGFAPAEQSLSVASGDKGVTVTLTLKSLELVPAVRVELTPPSGPTEGVVPVPPPSKIEAPPPTRGVYALGLASLLFPTRHPKNFPEPQFNSGASGGVRVGYHVNAIAGFGVLLEHGSVYTPSDFDDDSGYTLISNRIGLELRLMTPGKRVRMVGMLGGGVVHDDVKFEMSNEARARCEETCKDSEGWNPFFLVEAGVELDIDRVLLGLALQGHFQASRGVGIEALSSNTAATFDNEPLIHVGPGLRIGYRFW